MLEILYRIYEVAADGEIVKNETFGIESISKVCNHEIAMDCTVCDSRDQFKQLMRECYGGDIKFAYNRKYPPGTMYCIIIGEHCYSTDAYFVKHEYTCPDVNSLFAAIHHLTIS